MPRDDYVMTTFGNVSNYVSRLLAVAFLVPDIVERILSGDHTATLTPERLRKACPLPTRLEEQRAMLLD